ncbi:MAG: hypothetical protein A3E82_03005 [Gammaproteobacteria bacterium RIFCSPHIGHO2_12_FULL_38_11]|nr:MAG: hypothetical protein A3E82_03005 [Gammaproteobacteria bacterium RIFCSPHIGHO2_12_FULL_38_11]
MSRESSSLSSSLSDEQSVAINIASDNTADRSPLADPILTISPVNKVVSGLNEGELGRSDAAEKRAPSPVVSEGVSEGKPVSIGKFDNQHSLKDQVQYLHDKIIQFQDLFTLHPTILSENGNKIKKISTHSNVRFDDNTKGIHFVIMETLNINERYKQSGSEDTEGYQSIEEKKSALAKLIRAKDELNNSLNEYIKSPEYFFERNIPSQKNCCGKGMSDAAEFLRDAANFMATYKFASVMAVLTFTTLFSLLEVCKSETKCEYYLRFGSDHYPARISSVAISLIFSVLALLAAKFASDTECGVATGKRVAQAIAGCKSALLCRKAVDPLTEGLLNVAQGGRVRSSSIGSNVSLNTVVPEVREPEATGYGATS